MRCAPGRGWPTKKIKQSRVGSIRCAPGRGWPTKKIDTIQLAPCVAHQVVDGLDLHVDDLLHGPVWFDVSNGQQEVLHHLHASLCKQAGMRMLFG